MSNTIDNSVIPGASYYVYEGNPTKESSVAETPGGLRGGSKYVTFYTFDGNPIVTMEHNMAMQTVKAKLDPTAPIPKVASYRRVWWPAHHLGWGMRKGVPGYAIFFHDKNGNRIGWGRLAFPDQSLFPPSTDFYDLKNPSCIFPYDISDSVEEPADFSEKSWFDLEKSEKLGCVVC